MPVGEGDENLSGLIVRGCMAEITTRRQLSDFPAPVEKGHLSGIYIHVALQAERRLNAL
jgi:hypothetical protein